MLAQDVMLPPPRCRLDQVLHPLTQRCPLLAIPLEQSALQCGFDFVMAPLVHPRYRRPAPSTLPRGAFQPPFTRSDLLLTSSQWSGQVVGKVSPWIDCDSANAALARDSVAALQQELAWAAHLSLQAVVLPPPPQPLNAANYARALNAALGSLTSMALWLRIPAALPAASSSGSPRLADDPWEWWNQLRFLCHHSPRLGVLLELGADLPAEEDVHRWHGEPLK